jgi:hypothetical protein
MYTAIAASGILVGAFTNLINVQRHAKTPVSPWLSAGLFLSWVALGYTSLGAWDVSH